MMAFLKILLTFFVIIFVGWIAIKWFSRNSDDYTASKCSQSSKDIDKITDVILIPYDSFFEFHEFALTSKTLSNKVINLLQSNEFKIQLLYYYFACIGSYIATQKYDNSFYSISGSAMGVGIKRINPNFSCSDSDIALSAVREYQQRIKSGSFSVLQEIVLNHLDKNGINISPLSFDFIPINLYLHIWFTSAFNIVFDSFKKINDNGEINKFIITKLERTMR